MRLSTRSWAASLIALELHGTKSPRPLGEVTDDDLTKVAAVLTREEVEALRSPPSSGGLDTAQKKANKKAGAILTLFAEGMTTRRLKQEEAKNLATKQRHAVKARDEAMLASQHVEGVAIASAAGPSITAMAAKPLSPLKQRLDAHSRPFLPF